MVNNAYFGNSRTGLNPRLAVRFLAIDYFELAFFVNITRLSKGKIACSLSKNSAPVLLYSHSESMGQFETESVL